MFREITKQEIVAREKSQKLSLEVGLKNKIAMEAELLLCKSEENAIKRRNQKISIISAKESKMRFVIVNGKRVGAFFVKKGIMYFQTIKNLSLDILRKIEDFIKHSNMIYNKINSGLIVKINGTMSGYKLKAFMSQI